LCFIYKKTPPPPPPRNLQAFSHVTPSPMLLMPLTKNQSQTGPIHDLFSRCYGSGDVRKTLAPLCKHFNLVPNFPIHGHFLLVLIPERGGLEARTQAFEKIMQYLRMMLPSVITGLQLRKERKEISLVQDAALMKRLKYECLSTDHRFQLEERFHPSASVLHDSHKWYSFVEKMVLQIGPNAPGKIWVVHTQGAMPSRERLNDSRVCRKEAVYTATMRRLAAGSLLSTTRTTRLRIWLATGSLMGTARTSRFGSCVQFAVQHLEGFTNLYKLFRVSPACLCLDQPCLGGIPGLVLDMPP
jgi:hypothetical protein